MTNKTTLTIWFLAFFAFCVAMLTVYRCHQLEHFEECITSPNARNQEHCKALLDKLP